MELIIFIVLNSSDIFTSIRTFQYETQLGFVSPCAGSISRKFWDVLDVAENCYKVLGIYGLGVAMAMFFCT